MTATIGAPAGARFGNERRIEGRAKVAGQAIYAADMHPAGMLFAAFATGTHAHARIRSIDVTAARNAPGVHAVLTGADIGDHRLGRCLLDWPVLALDRVRFIGEYVAAVAAETAAQAQAAAALIDVEYDELPPVFTPDQALAADAPVLHDDAGSYPFLAGTLAPKSHPNVQGVESVGQGDVDAVFGRAHTIVEHRFRTPRMHTGYIEPRATCVWLDDGGIVHIISTNKSPYALRQQFAAGTGLPEGQIVIEPAFIGGDFGGKGLSIDEFACYYLARSANRPVRAVRTYLDDIQSTTVRHAAEITTKSALDERGAWTAFELTVVFDGGAYAAGKPIPNLVPGLGPKTAYHVPNTRMERTCVYTNTVPGGHVRAPSDVQIFFALESHVDELARRLGEDPLDFRLRHAIRGGETDFDGTAYHEPHAADVLEGLRASAPWQRATGPGRGRGIAMTARHIGGGKTSARFVLRADGSVTVQAGMVEQGAGAMTVVQRIVATELGRPLDTVFVERMSTANAPPEGGAGASKVTHILGRTAERGAHEVLEWLREAVAADAGVAAEAVSYADQRFRAGGHSVDWNAAARLACAGGDRDRIVVYDSATEHAPGTPEAANFCGFAVAVTVDEETGAVTVDDVACVVDVGAVINPVAHRGQIDGGFVWGLGHALMEELVLDDGKIVNLSLADYKLPTIRDVPPFTVVELAFHDGPGPYGAKAAGEISTAGVPPAIANAIADACGARVFALPLTAERVYDALRQRGAS